MRLETIPMKLRYKRFLTTLCSVVSLIVATGAGCGSPSSTTYNASPISDFDKAAEPFSLKKPCDVPGSTGCADVFTSGSLVGDSFVFRNLKTKCEKDADGFKILITNSDKPEDSSFEMEISLYKVETPASQVICRGIEYTGTIGNVEYKKGYCTLSLRYHDRILAAGRNTACILLFNDVQNPRGFFLCSKLEKGEDYVIIDGSSQFSCPKT
jgi:hypothetical protein